MHRILSKEKILIASKFLSIGLMIVMLYGFLQVTDINTSLKSQSSDLDEVSPRNLISQVEDQQDCSTISYYMYHMSVFLLGAFINVKGFIKVGVF